MSGPKIEMIGIAKNNLRAQLFNDVLRYGFHRARSTNGHEGRGFDIAVSSRDACQPRGPGLGLNREGKGHMNMLQAGACPERSEGTLFLRRALTTFCYTHLVTFQEEHTLRQLPVLVVHGGAWAIPDDMVQAHLQGVQKALAKGWQVLEGGGSALDAVEAAIVCLEDD